MFPTLSSYHILIGFALALSGYVLYRAVLPKPIPGIPYNKQSTSRILGDLPELLKWQKGEGQLFQFLTHQLTKHNSPIVQLFLRPFGQPWVVICDFCES